VTGYTYDTGALIAAERGNRQIWVIHRRILERGLRPTVPSPVLAQAWRGGPQAQLSLFLRGCRVDPLTETQSRLAGAALAKAKSSDIVDAVVVVGANGRGDAVFTSDPDDIRHIASALRVRLDVRPV
jgi:hypothetical protein